MEYLTRSDWCLINEIVEQVGASMSVADVCANVLSCVQKAIPCECAHFMFFGEDSDVNPVASGVSLDVFRSYNDYYIDLDDIRKLAFNEQCAARSSEIIDYREWKKTEYFNDFLCVNGFYYLLGTDIHFKNTHLGTVTLIRGPHSPDFSDRDLMILNVLRSHIGNNLQKLKMLERRSLLTSRDITMMVATHEEQYGLTSREAEVVNLVIRGKSNVEISDTLFISVDTVKKHLNAAFRKTRATSRTELMAILLGLATGFSDSF